MINENEKEVFKKQLQQEVMYLNHLWKMIETHDLKNEQFVLDWLDELNEISTRN